ncbi:MAG TPA: TetR/AcrR family transcriptional regulator [Candidatus Aquilonibacter sp.]|nr:TetR/AcrR family transcriptional regulator [Candidatus Aquilonibacter sp.]
MSAIAADPVELPRYGRQQIARPRSAAKRSRIIDTAMHHFAENGYHAARVGDMAAALGIAKGSIFQHFGSKDGLFFEVYKRAVRSFPKYLDAPAEVRAAGFFDVLNYWLISTEHLLREDWIPYRISLLGNYGTDLALKREINRFLVAEDPYGTVAFVRFGLERGELRDDMDVEMIVSILDWTMERFQDALLTAELDPGLFRRQGELPEKKEARIQQFLSVLRRAVGCSEEPAVELRSVAKKVASANSTARVKPLRPRS